MKFILLFLNLQLLFLCTVKSNLQRKIPQASLLNYASRVSKKSQYSRWLHCLCLIYVPSNSLWTVNGASFSVCIQQSRLQWWICRHLNPWAVGFYLSMEKLKILDSITLEVFSTLNNQYLVGTWGVWMRFVLLIHNYIPSWIGDLHDALEWCPTAFAGIIWYKHTDLSIFCLWDNIEVNVQYPAGRALNASQLWLGFLV